MPRRRKKNNKFVLFVSIIFSLGILFIFLGFLKKYKNLFLTHVDRISSTQINNTGNKHKEVNYFIGKQINFLSGVVEYYPIYGYYFFQLKTSNNKKFGLRSDKYTLSEYSGKQIRLKGEVVDFYGNIPIIKVDQIFIDNSFVTNSGDNLTGKELTGIYNLVKYGLIIDLRSFSGYRLSVDNDKIYITYSGEKLVEIDPFICQTGNSLYDCRRMYDDFTALKFENFVSSNGLKYFHISESDTRFTTNSFIWGYYITPISSEVLFKLSSYIYPYDLDSLKRKLQDVVLNICHNDTSKLEEINKFDLSYSGNNFDTGYLVGLIQGLDIDGKTVKCEVSIKFEGELPVVKKLNYEILTASKGEKNDSEKIQVITGDYLKTHFSHGFNVAIPTKNVVYKQIFRKTNLGIENLNCDYQVLLSLWKNRNNLDTDPDVVVYRCSGNFSKQDLKNFFPNYVIVSKGSFLYIIKYKNGFEKLAKNIKILN